MSFKRLNKKLIIAICIVSFFMFVFLQADKKEENMSLEKLQRQVIDQGYSFTVGKNSVSHIPLKRLCGLKPPKNWGKDARFDGIVIPDNIRADLPASFDWRDTGNVTSVKNQGSCGSCWAFGTLGSYEAAISINFDKTEDLSEQWLVDCNTQGFGCNGGWFAFNELYNGIPKESCYPYTGYDGVCQSGCTKYYPLSDWYYVGNSSSVPTVNSIKNAIYNNGPVAAAVYVNTAFQYYTGGIFDTSYNGTVNHAIALVGWNDTGGYWILKNSWGTGWGENGYMRIAYGCQSVGYASCYGIPTDPGTPEITVISPNGGENWPCGSTQTILWSSSGITGNVKIYGSVNNGDKWHLIATTANDGSYIWTVPTLNRTRDTCLIGILSVDNPSVKDKSDSTFTISVQ